MSGWRQLPETIGGRAGGRDDCARDVFGTTQGSNLKGRATRIFASHGRTPRAPVGHFAIDTQQSDTCDCILRAASPTHNIVAQAHSQSLTPQHAHLRRNKVGLRTETSSKSPTQAHVPWGPHCVLRTRSLVHGRAPATGLATEAGGVHNHPHARGLADCRETPAQR